MMLFYMSNIFNAIYGATLINTAQLVFIFGRGSVLQVNTRHTMLCDVWQGVS